MQYNQEKRLEVAKRTVRLSELEIHELDTEIRENISRIRVEQNFSYGDLAEMTGISESYLYHIMDGTAKNLGLRHVYKIMLALNIRPDELFPKRLLKRQKKGEYGEKFEYLVQGMTKDQIDFLMNFTEMYAEYVDTNKKEEIDAGGKKGEDDG